MKIRFVLLFVLLSGWSVLWAAPDGMALFEEHCVVCHRAGGDGGIGLPLQKSKFASLSDSYLEKTIRLGRPGRIMPAFNTLSDIQVSAIIAYLRARSGGPARTYPAASVTGKADAGEKLYVDYCQSCHGQKGRGAGKGTGQTYSRERQYKVIPPAISNSGFLVSAPDAMIKEIIRHGLKGTKMPAFAQKLDDQQINDIIVYLRESGKQRVMEPFSVDGPMPSPSIIVQSPHSFEDTVQALKQALVGSNYRVFPDRHLEHGLQPEWEVNQKQLTVRYCNFNDLYDMLLLEPRLGTGLPCRITVIEDSEGQVRLIAMNMALIARLFNNDQLQEYAQQMNNLQLQILEEVTF